MSFSKAYDNSGLNIGLVSKVWNGLRNESSMTVDLFRVNYPQGADTQFKAVFMTIPILFVSNSFMKLLFFSETIYLSGFDVL